MKDLLYYSTILLRYHSTFLKKCDIVYKLSLRSSASCLHFVYRGECWCRQAAGARRKFFDNFGPLALCYSADDSDQESADKQLDLNVCQARVFKPLSVLLSTIYSASHSSNIYLPTTFPFRPKSSFVSNLDNLTSLYMHVISIFLVLIFWLLTVDLCFQGNKLPTW